MDVDVIWPYELFTHKENKVLKTPMVIFSRCKKALDSCDMVTALLDGPQVDDETAWEIGYFYSHNNNGNNIIGVRTDFRKGGETLDSSVNAMIEGSYSAIVHSSEQAIAYLWKILKQEI